MLDDTKEAGYYFKGDFGSKIIGKKIKTIFYFYTNEDNNMIGLVKEKNNDFYKDIINNKIIKAYLCGDEIIFDYDESDFYYGLGIKNHIKEYILNEKKLLISVFNEKEDLLINWSQNIDIL